MTAKQRSIMAMDWTEVVETWQNTQHGNRAKGLPFYEVLIDPVTDEVMAKIVPLPMGN